MLPGVYVTFTGPLPPASRIWAALLYAGPQAVASHQTAAWLAGLQPELPDVIDVCVPHSTRHPRSRRGIRVRQCRQLSMKRHPVLVPPQTRLDDTVLDLVDEATDAERVIDFVLRACQKRLTTPLRLREAAARRSRLRWRRLLAELVMDVRAGVHSALELRYVRDVERAHGLPRGQRNKAERDAVGIRRYRDVRYRWKLIVELDGGRRIPLMTVSVTTCVTTGC